MYYFVSFFYKGLQDTVWFPANACIEQHPLEWEQAHNEQEGAKSEVMLASWQGITEEQYLRFK